MTLDTEARYAYRGVAWAVLGWVEHTRDPEPEVDCTDDDCGHEEEWCWNFGEPEVTVSDEWVRAVMVGDDEVHEIELSTLVKIHDEDYCGGCGQIGCGW